MGCFVQEGNGSEAVCMLRPQTQLPMDILGFCGGGERPSGHVQSMEIRCLVGPQCWTDHFGSGWMCAASGKTGSCGIRRGKIQERC